VDALSGERGVILEILLWFRMGLKRGKCRTQRQEKKKAKEYEKPKKSQLFSCPKKENKGEKEITGKRSALEGENDKKGRHWTTRTRMLQWSVSALWNKAGQGRGSALCTSA